MEVKQSPQGLAFYAFVNSPSAANLAKYLEHVPDLQVVCIKLQTAGGGRIEYTQKLPRKRKKS